MTVLTHKHHKVPRHAGGTNEAENLVELTIAEHAEAHRLLYEKHGRWQDRVAWKTLSGQIDFAEARHQANVASQTGRPKSVEHRRKISERRTGKPLSVITRRNMSRGHLGLRHPPEVKAKISAWNIGKKIKPSSIMKMIATRQRSGGTEFNYDGVTYPSFSAAAHALKGIWGVSKEAARARVRRMAGVKRVYRRRAA